MEYISHSDYTKMLKGFGKETPKEMLKEGVEEGNAFTAGLAKAKKGETFKVDGKAVKDTSGYDDSNVKEASINDEYPESWKMREGDEASHDRATAVAERLKERGMDEEAVHIYLVDDMNLDNATATAVIDSVFYGAGQGPVSDYSKRRRADMDEGINLPSPEMQATGQTIVTAESDQLNRFSALSPDEREQLKEYIQSIKTIKQEISKLVSKAKPGTMMEAEETIPAEVKPTYQDPSKKQKAGGDRTALVMKKGEMWEDGTDESGDDIEQTLDPKIHQALHKLIQILKAEGLDAEDIQMLVKHEIETAGQQAVMGQWDM